MNGDNAPEGESTMRSINGMAERFRELLASPEGIELPGCYDVLSAAILERVGFKAVFMSGYGVAASFLGNPDIGLTSLVETSLVTKNVASALHVPLVVDADNGYGNEDNVVRTVSELEHAGAAAMILEDQVFPKRCGHAGGKKVIPLEDYMRKLTCALKARQTAMCVVARTDATTIDEGIHRAKQFHAAGADVLLIDGLPSHDALERVGREVPGHKVINLIHGGKTPLLPSRVLHELGFKIVLYSTPALYTAAHTLLAAMKHLQETRDLDSISPISVTFRQFQHMLETQYLARRGNEGLRPSGDASVDTAPTSPGFTVEESTRSRLLRALPPEPGQA
jgi:2-methylisocitrate lyase-like PEP mutase family enzyme